MFRNKHLPRFQKICFCIPLKVGNIILVVVNLIFSLAICYLYLMLDYIKFIIRIFNIRGWDNWLHKMIRFKTIPLVLAVLIVIFGVAEICLSVVALIGLHKKKHRTTLMYMYYLIFTTIMMALTRIFDMENHIWYYEIGFDLFYYAFKAYYILSIRSQIKSTEELKATVMYVPDLELDSNDETNIDGTDLNKQNIDSVKIMTSADKCDEISAGAMIQ